MKAKKLMTYTAAAAIAMMVTGCEGEKDLIIIEGNLPIKTSTLYMVGDATPNGWSIDAPTPLVATDEDPLVFTWEGTLRTGEMKLCLITGSWDAPFIRPEINGTEIGKTDIDKSAFAMHAGDPDDKWVVKDKGEYLLTFDLRNWTMSTHFKGETATPVQQPLAADALYIVGDATPNGWNIDSPTALEKKSDYIFEYYGILNTGELKGCTETGSWDVSFVRPSSADCIISNEGVAAADCIYTTSPDDKWKVTVPGTYRLTFDLEHWTVSVEFIKGMESDKKPIETETLIMIGDATPGGWSMDDATSFTPSASDPYLFTWQGYLLTGDFKACLQPDGTFSCPFIRPSSDGCKISPDGVEASDFIFTTGPDYKWKVTIAGNYLITFNLKEYTITVNYLD